MKSDHLGYQSDEDHRHDRVAILVARWHSEINDKMYEAAAETLKRFGVERISKHMVPGAYELPLAARALAEGHRYDAIICLGTVIKGETRHNEYISQAVAEGLMRVSLRSKLPIIFGVLTTENVEQALDRAGGNHGNKGEDCALAALEMIHLLRVAER